MEYPPVRHVMAGVVIASLTVFTGTFSYGLGLRNRAAEAVPVSAPARAVPEPPAAEAKPAASTQPKAKPAPAAEPSSAAKTSGPYIWPVDAQISSYFGPRWGRPHKGIDLAANMGAPIRAAKDGDVLYAGPEATYGQLVIIRHADGTRTLYAHCSVLKVRTGDKVKQGQTVALVGSTGRSTGPHLHFEVIVNDAPKDPLLYLPKR